LLENADVYGLLESAFSPEERQQMTHYRALRRRNMHKMQPVPVCTFDK